MTATKATIERLLPHDLTAERVVLGAVLLHNSVLDALESLTATDFFRAAHEKLYAAMLRLHEAGLAIDLVTLRAELARTGDLDEVGGPAYIAALVDGVPMRTPVAHHAVIILEQSRRRQAIYEATRLTRVAYDSEQPASALLGDAAERLLALSGAAAAGRAVPLSELVPGGLDSIERAHKTGSLVTGLATGFTELDELTSGMHPADLFVVAARTSVGKTAFALTVARNVAAKDGVVLVHSCEMSKEQLFLRLLASEAEVDLRRLRAGRLSEVEWTRVSQAVGVLGGLRLFIDDMAHVSCREVRARARSLRAQFGMLALIVVDYLQLMRGSGSFENRTQEIGSISRGLKGVAKEMGVPVIALSQLKRAQEGRRDKRPQLSDLRESGDIENDSDTVLMLYRPEDADNQAEVIIAKQRNGPIGIVKLRFLDYCTRFSNLTEAA